MTFIVLEQLLVRRPRYVRGLLVAAALSLVIPAAQALRQLLSPDENFASPTCREFRGPSCTPTPSLRISWSSPRLRSRSCSSAVGAAGARWRCVVCSRVVDAVAVHLCTWCVGRAWIVGCALSARQAQSEVGGRSIDRRCGRTGALSVPSIDGRVSDLGGAPPDREIGDGTANSLEWRLEYWQDILPLWQENPMTGIGIDQVAFRERRLRAEPHNGFRASPSSRPAVSAPRPTRSAWSLRWWRDLRRSAPPGGCHRRRPVARLRSHCGGGGIPAPVRHRELAHAGGDSHLPVDPDRLCDVDAPAHR